MAELGKIDLNIEVNARIVVDEKTFFTCLKLINIYGLQNDLSGMVLRFDDDPISCFSTPAVQVLQTPDEVRIAMSAPFCTKNKESED